MKKKSRPFDGIFSARIGITENFYKENKRDMREI